MLLSSHKHISWILTRGHLLLKQTLNLLYKLATWLSCVVSIYQFGAFDFMLLSCHLRVSEWIYTFYFSECQGNLCLKQAKYLKFKWLQQDSNLRSLNLLANTQPFSQIDQMILLCREYLFVRCMWLYNLRFKVNLHCLVAWMSTNSLLITDAISEASVTATIDCFVVK